MSDQRKVVSLLLEPCVLQELDFLAAECGRSRSHVLEGLLSMAAIAVREGGVDPGAFDVLAGPRPFDVETLTRKLREVVNG